MASPNMANTSYAASESNPRTSYMLPGPSAPEYVAGSDPGYMPAPPPDTRGEIHKGILRGVDNLQALGYGAAGLVSDALGNKSFATQMYEGVRRNLAEAAQSPAAVAQFTDIASPKDAWDWFWGAAAEALPSSVASLATSGAGALLFRAAATKLATDALVKTAVFDNVGLLVARGATESEAKKAVVKQFFAKELAAKVGRAGVIGSYAGGAVAGTGMEAGSNWNEDVQKYGIQNTSPMSDLGYGALGGLVEAGLGPERQLVGKFVQDAARKELTRMAERGVLKNIGYGMGKASLQEGGEEFTQQMLNQMSLARDPFTQQNWKDNFNAGMGGMAGGVLFGAASGAKDASAGAAFKAQGGLEKSKAQDDMLSAGIKTGVVNAQANEQIQNIDKSIEAIKARKAQILGSFNEINDPGNDPVQRAAYARQQDTELMELTAQHVNLEKQREDVTSNLEKQTVKLDRKMVDATSEGLIEKAQSLLYDSRTAEEAGSIKVAESAAKSHAQSEINKANSRVSQHLAAIKALESATESERAQGWGLTNKDAELIKFHEKQINDETKYIGTVKSSLEKALNGLANPNADMAPGADLRSLYRARSHATNAINAMYNTHLADKRTSEQRLTDARAKLEARKENNLKRDKLAYAFSAATNPDMLARSNPVINEFTQAMESTRAVDPNATTPYAAPMVGTVESKQQALQQQMAQQRQARRAQLLALLEQKRNVQHGAEVNQAVTNQERAETQHLWGQIDANNKAPMASASKEQAVKWIKGMLKKMPVLRDITKIIHTSELYTLPKYVQDAYKGNPSLIDLKTGTIYLFSDNVHSASDAVRALAHEGIAHFGLRVLMTPDQLNAFFKMVAKEAEGTNRWEVIKEKYSDYDLHAMAEEYIADIAERIHLSKVDMPSARRAWTKIYYFLRDILVNLGWVNITRKDIDNVITATVYHLVNMDPEGMKRDFARHMGGSRSAMAIKYDGFYSPIYKYLASLNIKTDKEMPVKYWVDQIWPGGKLRQGLSEEEMQYYDDMTKTLGVFNTFKDMVSATNEFNTLSKSELMDLLTNYNTVELEEEVQGGPANRQALIAATHAYIDNQKLLGDTLVQYLESLRPDIKHGELHSSAHRLSEKVTPDLDTFRMVPQQWANFERRLSLLSESKRDLDTEDIIDEAIERTQRYADKLDRAKSSSAEYKEFSTDGSKNHRNFAIKSSGLENYSSHAFDQGGKNLMWIRTSDITTTDGKRALMIEEIQSDRLQTGEKGGFAPIVPGSNFNVEQVYLEALKAIDSRSANRIIQDSLENNDESTIAKDTIVWIAKDAAGNIVGESYHSSVDAINTAQINTKNDRLVPWTPITKSWPLLAIKRMIKYAADNGYDKVMWTSGEQQIDRWTNDLRANVKSIAWTQEPALPREVRISKQLEANALMDSAKQALVHIQDSYAPGSNTHGVIENTLYGFLSADHDEMIDLIDVLRSTQPYVDTVFKPWRRAKSLIAEISANPADRIMVEIVEKNGQYRNMIFEDGKYEDHTLDQVFGKDMAEKIMAQNEGKLEGEGLHIGGKGFITFYDKKLVSATDKYIKKLDSELRVYGTPVAGYKMHSFDITPTLRSRIENGQPAYGNVIRESRPDVVQPGDWIGVRKTLAYESKFGWLRNFKEVLKRNSYSFNKDRAIVPGAELTYAEKLMTGLHNSFDRGAQLVHTLHKELKKTGGKVTMAENFAEIEKTTPNRIATIVGEFYRNVMGIDPSNWAHVSEDGTLFHTMAKLVGSNKNIPSNPKELLFIVGKVLQAMHAEEANLELVRKQYKSQVMQTILAQVEKLEHERDAGNASLARLTAIDKKLNDLYDQAETVSKDIRHDLSGMSNEEAKQWQKDYITPNNAATWEEISQRVQGINKMFLDSAVKNHLLSPEIRAYWDKLYKNYVPLDAWEAHMKTVDPGFASMGRSFDMSMFELSKERKGNAGVETNPIILLAKKYTQLVQAIETAKVGTAFNELCENHPEYMAEIQEKDNSGDARKFSQEIKKLLADADKLIGGKNVKDTKQAIKELTNKIKELMADRADAKLRSRAASTPESKAKFTDKALKISADIQSAQDAIAVLKQNLIDIKNNPEYQSVQDQIKDLRKQRLANWNSRGYKVVIKDGLTYKVRKSNKFEGKGAEVITVFDNEGNKVRRLIKDPYLLAAFKGTSTVHPGVVLQTLGRVQRIMAQLMTTYAPPFIAVNWVRDTSTALIHMRNVAEDIRDLHWTGSQADAAFLKNVFGNGGQSAYKAALEFERKGKISDPRMAKMMSLYRKHGGYTSMYGMATYEVTQKNMERALKLATTKSDVRGLLFATANMMQDVSSAVENSTRLAAFTAIFEALVKNGVTEDKAAARAATAALDLTVNFTKKGTWSPILSSLFLFSQASINSTVRIGKAMFPESDKSKPILKRRITKYASGLAAVGFMMALAAKAMGGTDDDGVAYYDKLPDYVRSTNMVIAIGKNRFLRIPVTFGYQSFVALGNILADMHTGRTSPGKATSAMFGSMMENFSFIGGGSEGIAMFTPTIFKPLVQVYANQNYFGGKVYPESGSWAKGEQPDSQKYWGSTTELSKKAAYWLNCLGGGSADRKASLLPAITDLSPASLEHVLKQYSGGIGATLLGIIGVGEKLAMGRTEKLDIDSLPIASRFMSHVDNSATMSEYSRVKTELETQINEYKRAKAEKVSLIKMIQIMNETQAGRLLESRVNSIQHKMSTMKSELNKIELSKGSSAEDVYKKRIANEERAAALAKQLIRQAHVAGVK